MIIGIISAIDFIGNAVEVKALAEIALNLYLILAPVWAIGFGWMLAGNKLNLKFQ